MKPKPIDETLFTPRVKARWSKSYTVTDTCWLWTGNTTQAYGVFKVGNKHYKAHRLSYFLHKGEIPEGLVIDHLCRVKACINPDHLEAVTQRTNILRTDKTGTETHCINGHRNWRIISGNRRCYTCSNDRLRKLYRENPEYRNRKLRARHGNV